MWRWKSKLRSDLFTTALNYTTMHHKYIQPDVDIKRIPAAEECRTLWKNIMSWNRSTTGQVWLDSKELHPFWGHISTTFLFLSSFFWIKVDFDDKMDYLCRCDYFYHYYSFPTFSYCLPSQIGDIVLIASKPLPKKGNATEFSNYATKIQGTLYVDL